MKHPNAKQRLIGYARVSTDEQATEAQEMELRTAGCETIVVEHGSGASRCSAGARKAGQGHQRRRCPCCRSPRSPRTLGEPSPGRDRGSDRQGSAFPVTAGPDRHIDAAGHVFPAGPRRRRTAGTRADFGADQSRNRGRPEEGEAARQSGHPGATSCCAGEDRRGAASLIWRPHPGFHERLVAHGATNEAGPSLGRCGARLEPERCEVDARTTTTGSEMARCRTPG